MIQRCIKYFGIIRQVQFGLVEVRRPNCEQFQRVLEVVVVQPPEHLTLNQMIEIVEKVMNNHPNFENECFHKNRTKFICHTYEIAFDFAKYGFICAPFEAPVYHTWSKAA